MAKHRLRDRKFRHDAAYRRAKKEQYAGRAVYKLEEIDQKFRLFKPGGRVLDLGCWPGSWLQYVVPKIGAEGLAVGVDLKAVTVEFPDNVHTFEGDVFKLRPSAFEKKFGAFTTVISDMAPHTSGDRAGDQHGSEELFLRALTIARGCLRPGGHFAAKIFQGPRFPEILRTMKDTFQEAKAFRPASTRAGSFEQYLVGRGMRPGAALTDDDVPTSSSHGPDDPGEA